MDKKDLSNKIKTALAEYPEISLCFVFGSLTSQQETVASDLDIGVAAEKPLTATKRQALIEELAMAFGRPIDLIDLQSASGVLLHQILTEGALIFCTNHHLYGEIIKRMLFNQSDMMPYHFRILKERREQWINE